MSKKKNRSLCNIILEKWLKQTIDDYLVKHQENTHFASEKNFT